MMIGLIAVVVVVVLYLMFAYNGLVRLKVQCDNAWSDIDVQLKRRYDLVPNLVETVKGYAAHEKGTLEGVVAAQESGDVRAGPGGQRRGRRYADRRAAASVRAGRGLSATARGGKFHASCRTRSIRLKIRCRTRAAITTQWCATSIR